MKFRTITLWLLVGILYVGASSLHAAESTKRKPVPVNPNATKEAKALLEFIYSISGKYTMSGQHNFPNHKSQHTENSARAWGKVPAVWGSDFGFARDGDKDSYLARPDIVQEAIRQHKLGSIITLMWHAAPPTVGEPVTFSPPRYDEEGNLLTVQGNLTDEQFEDLLTPGTELYNKWAEQVDDVAGYLKQLEDANVPVLWRPYHEMTGNWFWWGARTGEYSTAALFRQIYDRLVNHHKINNLVWVWNVDRPGDNSIDFEDAWPGEEYVDICCLDVYGPFEQRFYDGMMKVSRGKPIALGEVGTPPTAEVLEQQPNWTWWMVWAGMGGGGFGGGFGGFGFGRRGGARGGTPPENPTKILLNESSRMTSLSDEKFVELTRPLRQACGLPQVNLDEIKIPETQ